MTSLIYKKPKGTLDLFDDKFNKFSYYKSILENVFIQNKGIPLETPVFELENILVNKYGEEAENKLIFKLHSSSSELSDKYALRYDLTIPLERFIIENGIKKLRRYSISKVYRKDQPSDGRYREFYQADFDIVGESNTDMINEFVLLKMAYTFLKKSNLENYEILINDTKNLKTILFEKVGINKNNFKSICQTIDKLDKYNFEELENEFIAKDLTKEQINSLKFILETNEIINDETKVNFNKLKSYCNELGFGNKLIFTSSMARGLDYYNGFIWEIKLKDFSPTIISGGRYDNLIPNTTMIGISFGLSRIMNLLNYEVCEWRDLYYLTSIGKSITINDKLKVMSILERKFGKDLIVSDTETPKKIIKEINYCIENKIRYMYVIGENEYKENKIIVKDLLTKTQELISL